MTRERYTEESNEAALQPRVGWTPLHSAIQRGKPEVVKALLRAGADVGVRSSAAGWSPLESAADEGNPEVVEALLDAGADLRARDNNGRTALHYASSAEVVEVLVRAGADVDAGVEQAEGVTLDGNPASG